MAEYNPRSRNPRNDDAPLSWSQRFYDSRRDRETHRPCGFRVPEPKL